MYPLDGTPVLAHVAKRVAAAEAVDRTVVATSTESPDEVIEATATRTGADVVRGSETDVLGRFERAVERSKVLVHVTADCPLISPAVLDRVVERLDDTDRGIHTFLVQRLQRAARTRTLVR